MGHLWFKPRGYRHFDAPVGTSYAEKACDPTKVASHSWLPLIHYVKRIKRYKKNTGKTVYKDRDIMFASHRDACILGKYNSELVDKLDKFYCDNNLSDYVIAYRKLGRSNYDFCADAYRFAKGCQPCVVLCFDITGFFDNLNHAVLKSRLKSVLGVSELTSDWYAVFRSVTRFSTVARAALQEHPVFSKRLKEQSRDPIATIAELHNAGILIKSNPNKFGIPQGTPISSAFSNVYMLEVDTKMANTCRKTGALYQRYSDDILIICREDCENEITTVLKSVIADHKLEMKDEKTERALFGPASNEIFQYLGFNVSWAGASIRPASLARQWRKAKRAIKTTRSIGERAIASGKADKIYTKRLRKRFAPVGARNFSKYARHAVHTFGSKRMVKQVMRLERMVDQAIRAMED